jgi:Na+-translocating ferredoxin:NAD+ oxidoreductase subunit G
MSITLGVVSTLSGFTLALVYQNTEPKIRENRVKALKSSLSKLASEVVSHSERDISEEKVFYLYDKDHKLSSYAVIAEGNGYQGEIKILVVVSKDLKYIRGIDILENVETPGLGGNITSRDFKSQFENLKILSGVDYIKGRAPSKPNEIQAVTGATISSASVVKIINSTLERVIPAIREHGE